MSKKLFIKFQIKFIFKTILVNLIIFFLFRALFLIQYFPKNQDLSILELINAFVIGLRFDFSAIFMVLLPFFLLLYIPIKKRIYYSIVQYLILIFSILLYIFMLGDFFYFPETGRRSSIEIFIVFFEFWDVIKMGFTQYFYKMIFSILLLFILFFIMKKVLFIFYRATDKDKKQKSFYIYSIVLFLVTFLIGIVAIRGGFQTRPLRTSMAFQSENIFTGNLALNGAYTVLTAIYRKDNISLPKIPRDKAFKTVQNLFRTENNRFLDKDFPFLRVNDINKSNPSALKIFDKNENNYNVVVIILESWSAKDLSIFDNKINATPFFNSLVKKGLLFRNHYATGQRSIMSLPSIISSIPTIFGRVYTTASYQHNKQLGLGNIFKKKGYDTYFTYAANKGSMGFSSYVKIAGFENVITREDFKNRNNIDDGTWGIYDEYTFLKMNEKFKKSYASKKHFLSVIYTLHPHPPFHLPKDFHRKYSKKETQRYEFFNALRYCDYSIQKFFEKAKKEKYFQKTLFVFVADHVYGKTRGKARYHIPLLFYSPDKTLLKKGVSERVGSQLDILPTILDVLNVQDKQASMGRSLLAKSIYSGTALLDMGELMGWVENNYLLISSFEKPIGLYNINKDLMWNNNLIHNKSYSILRNKLNKDWMSMSYSIIYSVMNNKITN